MRKKQLGQYFTPEELFDEFIRPHIEEKITNRFWTDLFAGEGNLILPILRLVPKERREEFFAKQVYLQEIDERLTSRLTEKLEKLGIAKELVSQRVKIGDSFREYPDFSDGNNLTITHITNPPYRYIGSIKKDPRARHLSELFSGPFKRLQDIYQIALLNDTIQGRVEEGIYILPTNFLLGDAGSRLARCLVLDHWKLEQAILVEDEVFEDTGTHVGIFFLRRKRVPSREKQSAHLVKWRRGKREERVRELSPSYGYGLSSWVWEWLQERKASQPLKYRFYLTIEEVKKNPGDSELILLDANHHSKSLGYERIKARVSESFHEFIRRNPLYLRTLDTGKESGRAGMYSVRDLRADGFVVTETPYRTHPIQVLFEEELEKEHLEDIRNHFNQTLAFLRNKGDDFLTTYKYSESSEYVRKYLGLKIAKAILDTYEARK